MHQKSPRKINYLQISIKYKPRIKFCYYVRNADNRNIFSKGYNSNRVI